MTANQWVGGFFPAPIEIETFLTKFTGSEVKVFIYLHATASSGTEREIRIADITSGAGVSERKVHQALQKLKREGYLTVHATPGRPNTYETHFPDNY